MKADLTLAERQVIAAHEQRELRAALVRRHVEVVDEEQAIEATQIAMDVDSPAYHAAAARWRN